MASPHHITLLSFVILQVVLISATGAALAAVAGAAAGAQPGDQHRHVLWDATPDKIPSTWTKGAAPSPNAFVSFHVALAGANVNVEQALLDVSDPRSHNYGKYLTADELRERFQSPIPLQRRVETFFQRQRNLIT